MALSFVVAIPSGLSSSIRSGNEIVLEDEVKCDFNSEVGTKAQLPRWKELGEIHCAERL